jgi:hypothetical protein
LDESVSGVAAGVMRIVDISPAVDELYVLEVSTLLWGELIGLAVIGVGGSNVCEKPDGSKMSIGSSPPWRSVPEVFLLPHFCPETPTTDIDAKGILTTGGGGLARHLLRRTLSP